jgi:uncharacterized membrane protein YhaH (DUF805 family)
MSAIGLALHLFDPRGRCDRRGLLAAAVLLLVLQVAVALALWLNDVPFDSWPAVVLSAGFCWVGFAVVSKRLHDLGRSAWSIPAAALVWLAGAFVATTVVSIVDPDALAPGSTGYWVALSLLLLPLLVVLLWLHLAAGDPGPNRYGPAPQHAGFSAASAAV